MIVVGKKILKKFTLKHAGARKQITEWVHIAEQADWRHSMDIKKQHTSASFLANNKVIFNICGNKYRLYVLVYYSNSVVYVKWVGTHAEYDKMKF